MVTRYLTDKEIKDELKLMLFQVSKYLLEHDLQYTIYGGTLLGAVRHNGFIPWDDDIDIGILRDDYEKLLEILRKSNSIEPNYYAIGIELGSGDWPFLKIVNPKISVDENKTGISQYLWIDIFPVDAAPNHFQKIYFLYLYHFWRRLFFSKRADKYSQRHIIGSNILAKIYNKILAKLGKLLKEETIAKKYINACKMFDVKKAKYFSENVWGSWQFPRDMFNDFIEYKFEDIYVKGIKEADSYLKILYGDYMELPPENMRTNHNIQAWRVEDEK